MGKIKIEPFEYLDKDIVLENLKSGTYKSRAYEGKSEVWTYFKEVVDENEEFVSYVSCNKCGTLFCYRHRNSGTSTLKKHYSQCTGVRTPSKSTKLMPKNVSKKDVNKIMNNSISVSVDDCKPPNPVEGEEIISKDIQANDCTENEEAVPMAESIIHITENNNGEALPESIHKVMKKILHIQPQKRKIEEDNPYEHALNLVKAANNTRNQKDRDEFTAFGENVAWTLRNLNDRKLVCQTKKRIYEVLCEMEIEEEM